ncbi:oxysterol-binding protein-related protein 1-like [Clytia hemisphaerica]|uniref:Oxysterol-binding protein n=1 Tax=Clytia hemisphaerica TaxID=252671 RepID=A0A7M6DPY7_9CNID|eukprot:TCONS_00016467-protein
MGDVNDDLLSAARNGNIQLLTEILESGDVDINCKGKHKSNLGWSPLHLAAYFGHIDVVEELLSRGSSVNGINGMGDTPLHRAAFTGRMDIVLALLRHHADVTVINGEGRTPLQMTDDQEVKKLIQAAERSQQLSRNEALLQATMEGDNEKVKNLLSSPSPPNINCQNLLGNTALHCAAFRGHKEIAVLLLQNGIDSTVKNNRGLSALEVSRDSKMRLLLDVQPLQAIQKTVQRFEGYILKRTRFFGWKKYWIVLERGILSSFPTRADASSGLKRQFFKYLDNAKISSHQEDDRKFKIEYSDRTVHLFTVLPSHGVINRQRWLNSLHEHCAYSTHYNNQPHIVLMDELDEDFLPLGSMQDALKNAQAHQQVLDQQVSSLSSYFSSLPDHSQSLPKGTQTTFRMKLNDVVSSSNEVCSTLNHCLTILVQQEEVRRLQLQQEAEKRRVLEDALHVLAREHFVLEQSIRSQKITTRDCMDDKDDYLDVFYDATETLSEYEFEASVRIEDESEESSNEEAPMTATTVDHTESNGVLSVPQQNDVKLSPRSQKRLPKYRKQLPATMASRNDFSVWNVLKQAVGKDLSRITMPVIFNEPLSFLQRISEYMDYVDILHKATETEDSLERLLLVSVFMISCNASTESRIGKPFNPLLGETFELIREDMDFKICAEQVSHHPPVSALYAESESGFELTMTMQPELKFWGKDIEVKPKGGVTIKIPKYNDIYTFDYISSGVHNIIVGQLWIELYGSCTIRNQTTGESATITFKPAGWFSKEMNQVEGYIFNQKKEKVTYLRSDWTKYVCSCPIKHESALQNALKGPLSEDDIELCKIPPEATINWKVRPKPSITSEMYMMTEFAMGLNELLDEHKEVVAPTDCRYRPDLRCLENGDMDAAAQEKIRLEEAQRARRKERNATGGTWSPRWFSYDVVDHSDSKEWMYTNKYFDRDFSTCPQIYE